MPRWQTGTAYVAYNGSFLATPAVKGLCNENFMIAQSYDLVTAIALQSLVTPHPTKLYSAYQCEDWQDGKMRRWARPRCCVMAENHTASPLCPWGDTALDRIKVAMWRAAGVKFSCALRVRWVASFRDWNRV